MSQNCQTRNAVSRSKSIFFTLTATWLAVSGANAEVITVDDDGKADFASIQAAVDYASDGDEILVAPGVYTDDHPVYVVDMLGKAITLRSSDGPDVTFIDGEGIRRGIVCFNGETNESLIEGFTVRNSIAVKYDYDGDGTIALQETPVGGGMSIFNSSPALVNCIFENNSANWGGGMYTYNGNVLLTDCTFVNNWAIGVKDDDDLTYYDFGFGGGLFAHNGSSTLANCTFTNNETTGIPGPNGDISARGGGMYSYQCISTLTDCEFSENSAGSNGGGMYNDSSDSTLTRCIFTRNTAGNGGGGLYEYAFPTDAHIQLHDCTFSENLAEDGGGLFTSESDASLTNCTFIGNTASGDGGGVQAAYYSQPSLIDCTFTANTAGNFGGGMHNYWDSAPQLNNCTFHGNSALSGGGMCALQDSNPLLTDCLFTKNSSDHVGGAIFNSWNSHLRLRNCMIIGNSSVSSGGGMLNSNSNPYLLGCTFMGNTSGGNGGALKNNSQGNSILQNCTIIENTSGFDGGGISNDESSPSLQDCTIRDNTAGRNGGGLHSDSASIPTLTNTVLCGNASGQMYGDWKDDGDNCISLACADSDGDGRPDCAGSGSDEYLTVPDEYATIELAIDAATDGAVIEVTSGTYSPVTTLNTMGKSLTLRGSLDNRGNPTTIIDGQDLIRVLECTNGEDANTTFENLVISRGRADEGGGMYNADTSPTLTNCIFTGNTADAYGGAMYNTGSSPTLVDCTFTGNSSGYSGGGIWNKNSSSTLANCTFENNSSGSNGGGLLNWESSLTLVDSTFTDNSADDSGGGLYNYDSSPTLSSCTFENNSSGSNGGGMGNNVSSPSLTNCTFTGNSAETGDGGGMYNSTSSLPQLTDTVLCGNNPTQVYGDLVDNGGNCILLICQDSDGDGRPDCSGSGTDEFLSVPDEYATIELAIDAAAEGAVIDIASGIYTPALTLNTLGKSITLRGAVDDEGVPTTVIDGVGTMRVLQCNNDEEADTVFENLVISGGHAEYGGGMHISSSNPTLINCTFRENAADYGGGMYNYESSPSLYTCRFTDNSSEEGGGMYNYENSSPALIDCTFFGNSASGGFGDAGGMNNRRNSSPTLTNCTFRENSARFGGGMYNRDNSEPELTDCVFDGNTADDWGGGMLNYSIPTLTNCIFTGNSANRGAGVHNNSGSGEMLVMNCIFQGNSAETEGGGIYDFAGTPLLIETTVCNNHPNQITGEWTDGGGNTVSDECPTDCPADFNGDGVVDGYELTYVLGAWGTDDPVADVNDDGIVDGADLNIILGAWGACP